MMSRRHRHALTIPSLKFRVLMFGFTPTKTRATHHSCDLISNGVSFRISTCKTHANAYLTNGFPLPNSKRLSLGRVPSRDKRSRGLRFHRNLFILLGRDREGLLRLSIVHRLGVLPGTFDALCFFVSSS